MTPLTDVQPRTARPAPPTRGAGCRELRRNRVTGHYVGLYDGIAADLDTDAGRWQTICEEHGTICSHETQATARHFMAAPWNWCEPCQAERDAARSCTEAAESVADREPTAAEVDNAYEGRARLQKALKIADAIDAARERMGVTRDDLIEALRQGVDAGFWERAEAVAGTNPASELTRQEVLALLSARYARAGRDPFKAFDTRADREGR